MNLPNCFAPLSCATAYMSLFELLKVTFSIKAFPFPFYIFDNHSLSLSFGILGVGEEMMLKISFFFCKKK